MRDPVADANDIFTLTDVGGTRFRIDLTNPGMYLVQLIVSWTNSFAEYRAINCNNGATVDDQLYGEGYGLTLGKGPFPSTGGPYFNIDSLTGYFFASESVSPYRLDPWVYQSSGVDRSFDALSLRVVYLGTIRPEASWEFLP